MKPWYWIFIFAAVIGIIFSVRFIFGSDEDTWLCVKGQWVKHGNPSAQKPLTTCE